MGRVHAYVAGIVTVLAIAFGLLLTLVLSAPQPATEANELADRFGVEIVWFDEVSPCGSVHEHGGCWQRVSPDLIYVQSGIDEAIMQAVVLHEIGHVLRHRLGLPQDECAADAFALSMGATWTGYDC